MDKVIVYNKELDPALAELCRAYEYNCIRELQQTEIESLKSLSLPELETELKKTTDYGRRRLITQVIRYKIRL